MAKKKWIAVLLSIIIPGLGLLYIDANKYIVKFLVCFFLSWLFVPWLLGIYWSATAPELK
jgi:TM2 domain-containing membrane protein YozV